LYLNRIDKRVINTKGQEEAQDFNFGRKATGKGILDVLKLIRGKGGGPKEKKKAPNL
jgi:hypothetical protein